MMFLFGIWMDWYAGMPGRLWQQTICWVFILLSGFCAPFGRHMLRRGVTVFAAGALVTAVTLVFMPGERVIFGVLTFLGTAMLLTGVLEPLLKKIPPAAGLAVSADIWRILQQEGKTALLVTHDIAEAVSMSDRVVVLSRRPAVVKAEMDMGALRGLPPLERRDTPEFHRYFNAIWKELDVHA